MISGLYRGVVTHTRLRPKRHRLRYRIFQLLFSLDELSALDRRLKLFSVGRFNLFSLRETDFGDGHGGLRAYVDGVLAKAGIDTGGGPVRLLTMPPSEPCLLLTRRTWMRSVPITLVRCLHPASRYRLGSRFRADGNSNPGLG